MFEGNHGGYRLLADILTDKTYHYEKYNREETVRKDDWSDPETVEFRDCLNPTANDEANRPCRGGAGATTNLKADRGRCLKEAVSGLSRMLGDGSMIYGFVLKANAPKQHVCINTKDRCLDSDKIEDLILKFQI